MSLKNRFIYTVSAILLSAFCLSNALNYYVAKDTLNNKVLYETLPFISDTIYSEIQNELMLPIYNTSLMAQDSFVINWVETGEKGEELQQYLALIKQKYNYSSVFFISDVTKNYYHFNGVLKQISDKNPKDQWYFDFINQSRPYDLDIDTDEGSKGHLTMFINHRLVNNEGQLLGVIGAGLSMTDIGASLESYRNRYNRLIYMTDSAGLIQAHPDKSLIEKLNINDIDGMSEVSKKLLDNKEGNYSYAYSGNAGDSMISVRYFADLDWFLIVEQNEEKSLRSIRNMLWTNGIIGVLVTIIVVFIITLLVKKYQRRIEKMASIDTLTGLYNRRLFVREFENKSSLARRNQKSQSLLLADIDHFKSINDKHGHAVGDDVLKQISQRLIKVLRANDLVGRWGGEEFVILLHDTSPENTATTAERIRQIVANEVFSSGSLELNCTISIGLIFDGETKSSLDNLLAKADEALYQAKSNGRDQVVEYGSL